jgi:hypothetical protein
MPGTISAVYDVVERDPWTITAGIRVTTGSGTSNLEYTIDYGDGTVQTSQLAVIHHRYSPSAGSRTYAIRGQAKNLDTGDVVKFAADVPMPYPKDAAIQPVTTEVIIVQDTEPEQTLPNWAPTTTYAWTDRLFASATQSADQRVEFDYAGLANANRNAGAALRYTDASNYIRAVIRGGAWVVEKVVNGATTTQSGTLTVPASGHVKFTLEGTTLRIFLGTSATPAVTASLTGITSLAGRKLGLTVWQDVASVQFSSPKGSSLGSTSGGGGGSGGLASRVVSLWYHGWQRPYLRELPADVRNLVNLVVIAMAQSGGAGTGKLAWAPANGQSVTDFTADVRALRDLGKSVVIGIGGSNDGGITITNATQVTEAFNSIVGFVTTYGLNGIDIDLEPSGSTWTEDALVSLCGQLKAKYGPSFLIGITPGLYGTHTERWLSLARRLGANYDYMAPMLYDFPEAADSRLSGVAVNKCDVMLAGGVPTSKQLLGFMCKPPEGYANASPPQVTLDAWNAVKAKYPAIRGGFIWEHYIEGRTSYQWTRLTGQAIASS